MLSHFDLFMNIRYLHGKGHLSNVLGGFEYFIEIDGQYVTRQVNVFKNGEVFRYTRDHWCDSYGMMFIGKFSLKKKAARGCQIITESEFNKLWQKALVSPNWPKQQNTAKRNQWGSWAEHFTD